MITKARYNNIQMPKFKESPIYSEGKISFLLENERKSVRRKCPELILLLNNDKNKQTINNFLAQCFDVQNIMSIYFNEMPVSMSSFFNMVALSANEEFIDNVNIEYCFDINNDFKQLKNESDIEYIKSLIRQQAKENKLRPIRQVNIRSLNVEYFEFVNKEQESNIDKISKLMGNFTDDVFEISDPDETYEDGIFARQIRISNDSSDISTFLDVGINNFEIKDLKTSSNNVKIQIRNLYKKKYNHISEHIRSKTITIFASEWLESIVPLKDITKPNKIVDLTARFISKKECILTWNADDYYSLNRFEISEIPMNKVSNEERYVIDKNYKFIKIVQDEEDKVIYYKILSIDNSGNKSQPLYIGLDFKNQKSFIKGDFIFENKISNSIISDFKNMELVFNPLSKKPFNELKINIKDITTYGSESVLQLNVIFPKFGEKPKSRLEPQINHSNNKVKKIETFSSEYYKKDYSKANYDFNQKTIEDIFEDIWK